MSKIDEIKEHLNAGIDDGPFLDYTNELLEQLRPYVELGELVKRQKKIMYWLFNDVDDLHEFFDLLELIKEQENE